MPPPQPGMTSAPTRAPFPTTTPSGASRIARTDTASLGSSPGYASQAGSVAGAPGAPQRVARTGTGNSVPTAIPVRAQTRVAGASPLGTTTGAPPVPMSRTAARVATGGVADPSSAMAPARSSSRSVSTASVEAAAPAPTPRAVLRARRVSKIIVEKEKKTSYWQDIIQAAKSEYDLSQEEVNSIIARAMALDVVGNWKQRETSGAGMSQLLPRLNLFSPYCRRTLLFFRESYGATCHGVERWKAHQRCRIRCPKN